MGGDGHSSEALIFRFWRISDVLEDFICLSVCVCVCVYKDILVLQIRWKGGDLGSFCMVCHVVFPHILKHESRGTSQMMVKNASVVCSKNRYCPGGKNERLKWDNVSHRAED